MLLGDGTKWIWRHVGDALGPNTVHITDWYHVKENLWTCAHDMHGEDTLQAAAFAEPIEALLWDGRLRDLRRHLDHRLEQAESSDHRQAIQALSTYLRNQGDRLVYDDFRAAGYDIGSGRVEAACKHAVAQRCKRSGMQWSANGFQNLMSLRDAHLNSDSDSPWLHQPLRKCLRN